MKIFKLFILFIISLHSNAQSEFVGRYSIHNSGRDVPNSVLYILPSNEYYLLNIDEIKNGKWKQIDKKTIHLIDIKENEFPIIVFGKHIKNQKGIKIDVSNIPNAHAFIDFTSDKNSKIELIPIFNEFPNCTGKDFIISKNSEEVKWMHIAVPENPNFGSEKTIYPYQIINYMFELDTKYNYFTIGFDQNALLENFDITITKQNDTYLIFDDLQLQKEIVSKNEIDEFLKNMKSYQESNNFNKMGIEIKHLKSEVFKINELSSVEPYFIVECEVANIETDLPSVDRENGFYEVTNFLINEYDIFKFNLSQNPGITINDIEKIEKKLSEYSIGFEIEITLNEIGRTKFEKLTEKNINKPIAIVIDKKIIVAPIVTSVISEGKVVISGQFTESQINNFIKKLKKN